MQERLLKGSQSAELRFRALTDHALLGDCFSDGTASENDLKARHSAAAGQRLPCLKPQGAFAGSLGWSSFGFHMAADRVSYIMTARVALIASGLTLH
jgi:hypothetical protein